MLTIGVVHPQLVLADGLGVLLSRDKRVNRSFSYQSLPPGDECSEIDVLVVDSGFARGLTRLHPHTVVLVRDPSRDELNSCLAAGVLGLLGPEASGDDLVAAALSASAGVVSISAGVEGELARQEPELVPHASLTERERQVLALLAQGLADKEIAARLGTSPRTASAHVSSIFRKLSVQSRLRAAAYAYRAGVAVPPGPGGA